jgi:sigma-B regulation protein RsbU (phosphoserine phosphatase)
MGDVCGKGTEAAAVTGLTRHTIRAAAMQERAPSKMLAILNRALLQERLGERFCTVVVGRLDRIEGGARIAVSCGGHPPPLLVRAGLDVAEVPCRGTLIGLFPDPELRDEEFELRVGDVALFYTDGVTEARNDAGEIFGIERLGAILASHRDATAAEIAAGIERAVLGFQGGTPRDDVALLVLRVRS